MKNQDMYRLRRATTKNPRLSHWIILSFFLFFALFTTPAAATETVTEREIEPVTFEGLIEPFEIVDVGTPVPGVVSSVNVQRSSSVHKGESLVLLDSSVEKAVLERAKVLAEVEGELVLQKERLAFAQRVHKRIEELFKGEAISAEKYDQALTEVTLARAQLQKAKENKRLAQLDLDRSKAILAQKTIKSPISGIVVERFVAPGEYVNNEPLLRVAQMDPLRVEVILPANMFGAIKPGMQANIHPEIDTEQSYSSTVVIVDRMIDPASGTFGVRLELPNPDYRLPSGLKCSVKFLDDNIISPPASPHILQSDTMVEFSEHEPQPAGYAQ